MFLQILCETKDVNDISHDRGSIVQTLNMGINTFFMGHPWLCLCPNGLLLQANVEKLVDQGSAMMFSSKLVCSLSYPTAIFFSYLRYLIRSLTSKCCFISCKLEYNLHRHARPASLHL